MARMTLPEFLDRTADGKIFNVTFVRRSDGQIRQMTCRRGVKRGVTGEGLKFDPRAYALLPVFDMNKVTRDAEGQPVEKGAYRMVNLEHLLTLKLGGVEYDFNQADRAFVSRDEHAA